MAIIGGTGRQGPGLALRFAATGLEVLIGSRSLDKAKRIAGEISAKLKAAGIEGAGEVSGLTNEAAAKLAQIGCLTIPYPTYRTALPPLRAELQGKILIDVTVPFVGYKPPEIERPSGGSAAEEVQTLLGDQVKVVGAFKTTPASLLAALERKLAADILVCGDDPQAKAEVIRLIERLDVRAFDAGPLKNSQVLEGLTAMLLSLNVKYKRRALDIRLTGI